MIAFVSGVVDSVFTDFIYLNVSDIGYEIFVTPRVIQNLKIGDSVKLYTYHLIREDDQRLFGFSDVNELDLFRLLITVNGVGPKAGMSILSAYSYGDIVSALQRDDERFFSSVSGIGKKGAAKIVIDLRGKFDGVRVVKSKDSVVATGRLDSNELVDALVSLGYSEKEVFAIITQIDQSASLTLQIKQALQLLAK